MSTDSDSEGRVSINSSVFSSPVIAPPSLTNKEEANRGGSFGLTVRKSNSEREEEKEAVESSSEDSHCRSGSTSSEKDGEVEEESEKNESDLQSTASVEEAQFDVMNIESDTDGSISF